MHYFGKWDDPQTALNEYLDQRDDLQAGRDQQRRREGTTLGDALNHFLSSKHRAELSGEFSQRSYWEMERIAAALKRVTLLSEIRSEDLEVVHQA